MKSLLLSLCATLLLPELADAETRYGSFRFDGRAPNALFLTGEIKDGDSFELRKALRDHGTSIIVMGSAGGNLYEGLQMGAILHDKGIATYVPVGVNCESSCANMFFGGTKRKAEGKLGVHQFYSADGSRSASLGEAEATTQYTMADVIGIMNELGTPPFVYEKMLGTTDIYYFPEEELRRLDVAADEPEFAALQRAARELIAMDPSVIARFGSAAPPTAPEPPTLQEPNLSLGNPVQPRGGSPDVFKETDFFGSDLSPSGIRGISLAECEQICRENATCAAWSYVHETRWCWPKSGVSNISIGVGIVDFHPELSRLGA